MQAQRMAAKRAATQHLVAAVRVGLGPLLSGGQIVHIWPPYTPKKERRWVIGRPTALEAIPALPLPPIPLC